MNDTNHESMSESTSLELPVLPTELFGRIIDILCERLTGAPLNGEQMSAVRVGFRLIPSEPQSLRLSRLAQLLEESPDIQKYPRHVNLDLQAYNYIGGFISEALLVRVLLAFIPLPYIESVTILFSHPSHEERRLTPQMNLGSLCHRLVQECISRGSLRILHLKKVIELPIALYAHNSLHTLNINRGEFNFTQPMESIRNLTLRKMELPLSSIFYFPAVENLQIMRCRFIDTINPTTSLAPPAGIKHLSLELCSTSGEHIPEIINSLSALVDFFRSESRKRDVEPFGNLKTLEISISRESDFSALRPLLRDAKMLDSISFQVLPRPISDVLVSESLDGLRAVCPTVSLKLTGHVGEFSQMTDGVPPASHLESVFMLPSFAREIPVDADRAINYVHLRAGADATQHNLILDHWSQWNLFLGVGLANNPRFGKIDEIEVCMFIDGEEKDGTGVPTWIHVMDQLAQNKCRLLGTIHESVSGTRSTVKLMFAVISD